MLSKNLVLTIIWVLISQILPLRVNAADFPSSYAKMNQDKNQRVNDEQKLVQAQTQFSFQLFSQISKDRLSQNLFISPSSVAIALSLLYNGADGQTKQEMAQVLGFQNMTLQQVNLASQQLQKTLLRSGQTVQVNIANSLWVKQDVSFRHQFLKNNRQYFDAEITNLNFSNPQSVGIINRWVSQQTQGKITEIIDRINSQNILFLINAIYFKGEWKYKFNPESTQTENFYLSNGKTKRHPLMSQQGQFFYQENETFQAISLPYGNGQWQFYVFLPKENSSLKAFLSQLNAKNWQQWRENFRRQEGQLKLPKFQSEYEIELMPVLKMLGLKSAFIANQANFSQMTSNPVVVDAIKHKTFVEVNEEGTEAAAVTSIGIRATSINPNNEPFQMIVNRPFFYSIVDEETGTILFMGTMANPSE